MSVECRIDRWLGRKKRERKGEVGEGINDKYHLESRLLIVREMSILVELSWLVHPTTEREREGSQRGVCGGGNEKTDLN